MAQRRDWYRWSPLARSLGVVAALLSAGIAGGQVAGAPKAPSTAAPAQSCTATCHQPIINHTVRHNATTGDCATCHVQVGDAAAHKFSLPVTKEELCIKCHQLPAEKHSHAPVRDGQCMACHDPHGSEHKAQLIGDPNRDLCVKCHNADFMKKKFVHGPVAVGACATCHKSHSSDLPKLLNADANALCKTCHADTGKPEAGLHVHKALDQGCVSCHDPHAADHKFQLREVAPQLCLSCHKEQFDKMTGGALVVHGAVTQEGGCTTCHEPHASKLSGLQRTNEVDSCAKCHDKPLKANDGAPLTNMVKLLASNPVKHGPIRDGHCTVCHDPHASKNFRLLPAEYPATFYAPFSQDLYNLCFQCHTADMVLKPNGQGVTQFRDGARNLHALHVNQEKGRTCRACHEVHASKRPSHVRESVPFGNSNWLLEINYKVSEQGGSCAPGCHAPKSYARPAARLAPPKDRPNPADAPAPGPSDAPDTAPATPGGTGAPAALLKEPGLSNAAPPPGKSGISLEPAR